MSKQNKTDSSQDNSNITPLITSQNSNTMFSSEGAVTKEVMRCGHDLVITCRMCQEDNAMLYSKVRMLELDLEHLRDWVKTKEEQTLRVCGQFKECYSTYDKCFDWMSEAESESTRMYDTVIQFKENLAQVLKMPMQKDVSEEGKFVDSQEDNNMPANLARLDSSTAEGVQQDSDLNMWVKHRSLTTEFSLKSEKDALLETVQDLQDSENSLIDQKNTFSDEFAQLKSQIDKVYAENVNLIYSLRENETITLEENVNLITQVAELEQLKSRNQKEIESLRATIVHAEEVQKDNNELSKRLAHMESLMVKKQSEMEKLKTSCQEKEAFLYEQNNIVHVELTQINSVSEEQREEIKNLKRAVKSLQSQMEDAHQVLMDKEEMIANLNREVAHKLEVIEEYSTLTTSLRQSVHDLEFEREMRQEEDVLAGLDFFQEDSMSFGEEVKDLQRLSEQRDVNLLDTAREAQEDDSINNELSQRLPELERTTENLQRECEMLLEKILLLEDDKESLISQNNTISAEFTQFKSDTEKVQAENANYIHALQESVMAHKNKATAEGAKFEELQRRDHAKIESLQVVALNLQHQLEEENRQMEKKTGRD